MKTTSLVVATVVLAMASLANASMILNVNFGTGASDNFGYSTGAVEAVVLNKTIDGHDITVAIPNIAHLHDSVGIILGPFGPSTVTVTAAGFTPNTVYSLTGRNENAYEGTNVTFTDAIGSASMINTPAMAGPVGQTMDVLSDSEGRIIFTASSGQTGGGDYHTGCLKGFDISGSVPEPATMALLAMGGLAMLRRRR
jgi:hypothetical protein